MGKLIIGSFGGKKRRRFTLHFTEEAYDVLKALGDRKGMSMAETIRAAITFLKWVLDSIDNGDKIIRRKPNGTEEIVNLKNVTQA